MDGVQTFTQYVRRTSPDTYGSTERTVFLVFAFPVSTATFIMTTDIFQFRIWPATLPMVYLYAYPGMSQFPGVCTWAEVASLCVATFRISAAKIFTLRLNSVQRYANTFTADFSPDLAWGREIVVMSTTAEVGDLPRVGEWIMFDSALSDADCSTIEQYLMQKFKIS